MSKRQKEIISSRSLSFTPTNPHILFAEKLQDNLSPFPEKKIIKHPRFHTFTARRKSQVGKALWKIGDSFNENYISRVEPIEEHPENHQDTFRFQYFDVLDSILNPKRVNPYVVQTGLLTANLIPIPLFGSAVTLFGINLPNTRRAFKEGNRKKAALYTAATATNAGLGVLGISSLIPGIGQVLGIGFLGAGLATTTLFYEAGNQAYDFAFQKDMYTLAGTILQKNDPNSPQYQAVHRALESAIDLTTHHHNGKILESLLEKERVLQREMEHLTKEREAANTLYYTGRRLQKAGVAKTRLINGIKRIEVQQKLDMIPYLLQHIQILQEKREIQN